MTMPRENWYRRLVGRRIERFANRVLAAILGGAGAIAAYSSLPVGRGGEVRWFGLFLAIILFWLARASFVARGSVIEEFGDEAGSTRRQDR